jgi:hypothetical protein
MVVWKSIYENNTTPLDTAMGSLILGALFFAMRSCEYSKTNKDDGKRKTKIITCDNVRFFTGTDSGTIRELHHDLPVTTLQNAECVSITFVQQKNGEKMETITQHKVTGSQLCPVRAWATTIKRVEGYSLSTKTSPVNTFVLPDSGKMVAITAKQIRAHIIAHVLKLGPDRLASTQRE